MFEVAEYQVRPRSFPEGNGWRKVSEHEFNDYDELPGYPDEDWERRKLYAYVEGSILVNEDELYKVIEDACAFLASDRGWDIYGVYRDELAEDYRAMLNDKRDEL